jgi:hypothetical protein
MLELRKYFKFVTKAGLADICRYFVIGMCQLSLIIFLLFVYEYYYKTSVGVVNITGIAEEFIKTQSKSKVSPEELKKRVRVFGASLERVLHDLGTKKRAVLMPAEAVITGATDYTKEVQRELSRIMRNSQQQKTKPAL